MKDTNAISDLVLSVDSLHGSDIDARIYGPWRNVPPIPKTKILKGMCRKGISPSLRSAIWMISIARNTKNNDNGENDEYGTLEKVNELQRAWEKAMHDSFPNNNNGNNDDEKHSSIPRFGLSKVDIKEVLYCQNYNLITTNHDIVEDMNEMGITTLKRVLITLTDATSIECCHLIPDITNIFLSHMSESQVFFTIKRMITKNDNVNVSYLPISKMEHYMWCKTFIDIMLTKHARVGKKLQSIGVLCSRGLDPIFKRFFVQIFKRKHILRLMDIFVIDGSKILFRLGITLLVMFDAAGLHNNSIDNALKYWNSITVYTHDKDKFNFDNLLARALGIKKLLRKFTFPNRNKIKSIMKNSESWAKDESIENSVDDDNLNQSMHLKPISYTQNEDCKLILPAMHRMNINKWIPNGLHDTKLDLVFSTNMHGRSLEMLYSKLAHVQCTLFLIEVLQTGDIIGMFIGKSIKRNLMHTAGECFIFSLTPNAACYQWNNMPLLSNQNNNDNTATETTNTTTTDLSLVVKDDYLAMGINKNGTCALRINEDMTEGESYACSIFSDNKPLAGDEFKEFEIGLIEVYQFLRFDNKSVGSNYFNSVISAGNSAA